MKKNNIDQWLKYQHIDYLICCIFKFSSIQQYFNRNSSLTNVSTITNIIEEILYKKLHENGERFTFYVEDPKTKIIYKKIESYLQKKEKITPSVFPNHKLKYNYVFDEKNEELEKNGKCIICDWFVRQWYFPGIACSKCKYYYHIYCIKNSFKYHKPECFPDNYKNREYVWNYGHFTCFIHSIQRFNKNNINYYYFYTKIYIKYNELKSRVNLSMKKYIPKDDNNGYIVLIDSKQINSYYIIHPNQLNYFTNATLKTSLIFNTADLNHDRLKIQGIGPKALSDLTYWKKSIIEHKNSLYDEIIDKFGLRNPLYYIDYEDNEQLEYTEDAHNYFSVTNEQVFYGNGKKFGTLTSIGWFSPNEILSIQFCICLILCSNFNLNSKTFAFRTYHCANRTDINHYHQYTNYVNHADYISQRLKLFISGGIYQQVAYGIHKLIRDYVGNHETFQFYSPSTFGVSEDRFKRLKQEPIITPLPSIHDDPNNYYDPLTKSLYNFLLYRCYAIYGKSKSMFINQMQFNLYAPNGFIKGHVDWIGWFITVLMMKLFNDGSLHFGIKGGHCNEMVLNTSYYFALMVGEIFQMKKWSLTHYFHSISSWMHEKAGITLILREFSEAIEFYYPSLFQYKDKQTTKEMFNQLLEAKPTKMPKEKVQQFAQNIVNQYLQNRNNNNNNKL